MTEVKGMQKDAGVAAAVKHFALNDQDIRVTRSTLLIVYRLGCPWTHYIKSKINVIIVRRHTPRLP